MATEVDPLVLVIAADLKQYRAQLRATTALVTDNLGRQQKAAQNLERQMQRSSGAISGSLKGLAGSLAAAFSVQQIAGVLDNFTKIQNALKIAGLEGEQLEAVQAKLFETAQQYGTSLVDLAQLYGNVSAASKELNLNQADQLRLTELTSAAIRAQGAGTAAQLGALQQFSQLLGGTVVQAQEYNSINDGARPILQAVANNIDRFGGSVAKLRAEVVKGKLSVQEFVQAALKGTEQVKELAGRANLTLAASLQALSDAFTVYVGQSQTGASTTAIFAGAIELLAKNLDTIIPLLAVIATGLGVGLVTNALASRVALAAVAAQAAGTTGALGTMGLTATTTGRALLGAFGGPVGLAITALTLGIGFLVTQTSEAAVAAQANARAQEVSAAASKSGADAADKLASAHGKARVEALALARAERENIKQKLASARASLILAQAELARAKAFSAAQNQASIGASTPGGGLFIQGTGDKRKALARQGVADQEARIAGLEKGLGAIDAAIKAGAAPKISAVGDPDKKKKGSKGASGPTAAEIEARFNNELIGLTQQTLSAQQSIAKSAEEKAELELRSIELARTQAIEGYKSDKSYGDAQRQRLIQQVETLAFEEIEAVAVRTRAQLAQEAADLADAETRNRVAQLEDEYDLATSIKDRARIAAEIADTETQAALAAVDRLLADKDIAAEKKKELALIRQRIVTEGVARGRDAANGNLSPIAAELRRLNETNFGDEAEKFGVDALKDLNAGLADAIVNGGNLGDVLEDTGKRFLAQLIELTFQLLVIKPLLESLGGAAGGISGGGIGGLIGSIGSLFGGAPARASGGPVSAGQVYRVNEGVGKEFFRPNTGGDIIPLSRMNAAQPSGGGTQRPIELKIYADEGGTFVPRVEALSAGVSVQVVQAASRSLTEKAVAETFRRAQRPGLGR